MKDCFLLNTCKSHYSDYETEDECIKHVLFSNRLEEKKRANTQPSVPKGKANELSELQKRLEEKKAERRREQEKSKLVTDQQSLKKTQGLIKQKVCCSL